MPRLAGEKKSRKQRVSQKNVHLFQNDLVNVDSYKIQLAQSLNELSMLSKEDLKKEFDKYVDKHGLNKKFKAFPAYDVMTVGKLCWMSNRGKELLDDERKFIDKKMMELQDKHGTVSKPVTETVEVSKKPVVNYTWLTALDRALDEKKYQVDLKTLKPQQLTLTTIEDTLEVFRGYEQELQSALTDSELLSAYASRVYVSRQLKFVQKIIAFNQQEKEQLTVQKKVKKIRKPRVSKKRESSATIEKLTQHFRVLPEWEGLTSAKPLNIIHAKCVVLYNSKYRILSILEGSDLSIHRMAVINYRPEKSMSYRLKQPHSVIQFIQNCSSSDEVKKVVQKLSARQQNKIQDRTSEHTIIVKIIK